MLRIDVAMRLVAAAVLLAFSSLAGRADPTSDFYRGKQIRIVVGTAAGQDYDIWARLIGRHMSRHVPGNPSFIIENMPGGGHIVATNYLYNSAPRDGTVLGMVTRNITDAAILGFSNVRFNPTKFTWLGSPEINHRVLFASTASGFQNAQELFARELVVGAAGAGQSLTAAPSLLKNALGMKLRVVLGYPAPQAVILAMERGEVAGIVDTIGGPKGARRGWIDSGKMRVLFSMEPSPIGWLKVPTIFEFLKTDEQRQIFTFFAGNQELGRPLLAPPGLPDERIDALRRAFNETMADPDFVREADSLGFEITARDGQTIARLVSEAMDTPRQIVDLVSKAADMN